MRWYDRPLACFRALVVLLCANVAAAQGSAMPTVPVGNEVGPITFDAIVQIVPNGTHRPEILFARYWVAKDFYRVAVIWMEPRGQGFRFPVYPESLSLGSDDQAFSMSHDIYPSYDLRFLKPVGDRGVFRCMFGDYPITNVPYAEGEAMAARLYLSDLGTKLDPSSQSNLAVASEAQNHHQGATKDLAFTSKAGFVDSLELFGDSHRLLKRLNYEYDTAANPPCLKSESVFLAERPMEVGFRSGRLTVKINGDAHEFDQFPTIYEKGGRKCFVEYGQVLVAEHTVTLPVLVEVRDGPTGTLLRRADMTNFHQTSLNSEGAEEAAARFAGLTPAHKKEREIVNKYWGQLPEQVSMADRDAIKELTAHFEAIPSEEQSTMGEQLRRINVLMELSLTIGNEAKLERNYQNYMHILVESNFSSMLPAGGYGIVEWAASQGRFKEAKTLLDMWVKASSRAIDMPTALHFAEDEIQKHDFWTCFRFLQTIPDDLSSDPGLRFERAAIMRICLHKLQDLYDEQATLKSGFTKCQLELASRSISVGQLNVLADECLQDSRRKLGETSKLSAKQDELKNQLQELEDSKRKGQSQLPRGPTTQAHSQ